MADKKSDRFQVHVTKGVNRGSKLATVLFLAVVAALGGAGYYFWAMQDRLVEHIRKRDGLALAATWALYLKGEHPEGAYEPLKSALESGGPRLRRAAARALGTYGRRDLVAPMLEVLAEDSDPAVRAAAALALGDNADTRNPLLVGGIRKALEDPHSDVRTATCDAVRMLELDELIPELIGKLGDSDRKVKTAARSALESFTEGDMSYEFNRQAWSEWYDGRR